MTLHLNLNNRDGKRLYEKEEEEQLETETQGYGELYKLSDEKLQEKAELVTEYLRLLRDYTGYDCGAGWEPEYADERNRIKTRLRYIRRELNMK